MNQEQPSTKPKCLIHKKPAFFVNSNFNQSIIQQKYPCEKCCNLYIYNNSYSRNQNRNENFLNKIEITNKQLEVLEQMLIFYENNILKEIQSINKFIKDQYKFLISLQMLQEQVFKNESEYKKSLDKVQVILSKLSIMLNNLSLASKINNFQTILKSKKINDQKDTLSLNLRQSDQQEQQQLDIVPITSIDHNKQCQAIAFSYDSEIMVAGYQNQIKVFEFKDQNLNEKQILDKHKKNVSYLQFMKSSKQFVSCSMDGQMIFWSLNSNNIWFETQIIHDSYFSITCVKFNHGQNILVSSGVDCLVKFYRKSFQDIWDCFYEISCSSYVVDFNFNNKISQLYICEYNNIVSVFNKSKKQKVWQFCYKINIQAKILNFQRLGHSLVLLLQNDHNNCIFLKQNNKQLIVSQQINLPFENLDDTSLPMQYLNNYNQSDCLLVCGGQQIYVLKNVNQQFVVANTYKTPAILNYARVSEDRKYLSYWNKQANKIQIMRLS